jgi:hypothetical protein
MILVCTVCCSDIIVSVKIILRLTYFCREWCEWYDINIIWWSVCNICATCELHVNTTGLMLFHYCITICVSTCDAWSSQDRRHDDGVHGGAMVLETTMIPMVILLTIWYDHICACDVYFPALLYYLCFTCGWCFVTTELPFSRKGWDYDVIYQ